MNRCASCNHPEHESLCGHAITETYRDDVGISAKPSGMTRTEIVDTCDCDSLDTPI